jgi:hypothetical protein
MNMIRRVILIYICQEWHSIYFDTAGNESKRNEEEEKKVMRTDFFFFSF